MKLSLFSPEDFLVFDLDSGVRVIALSCGKVPLFYATLMIKAGAERDPLGKEGLSDLVAESLTLGTRLKGPQELNREIEGLGASLEATSHWDSSLLSLSGPLEYSGDLLRILREVLFEPSFPGDELSKAKERRMAKLMELKDNAPKIADRTIWNLAMDGTPYSHPIGGTLNSIPGLAREDIIRFYKETYIPQRATLLVIGKTHPRRLLEESKKALQGWPAGEAGQDPPLASPRKGKKILILDRPDLTQSEIRVALPGVARQNRRYLAFKLMNYILGGGGFSSRLMERVRSQKGYTYGIRSSFHALRIPGPLIISTFTPTETTYAAFEEILSTLEGFAKEGPSPKELQEAKGFFKGNFPLRLETPSQLAREILQLELYGLDLGELLEFPERLGRVGLEEIRELASDHLRLDDMKVVIVGRSEAFLKYFEGLGTVEVIPYKDVSP